MTHKSPLHRPPSHYIPHLLDIDPESPIHVYGAVAEPAYSEVIADARVAALVSTMDAETYDPLFDGWGDLTPFGLRHHTPKMYAYTNRP